MITCKFCGNENMDGATVCYICGKSLTSGRINSLVGFGGEQPQQNTYHGVNDNLPVGADAQTAARFQSDTGGGVRSGPTQETFGAQMMSGKTEKKSGNGANIAIMVTLLVIVAVLVWYCFFSSNAPLAHLLG